jgi:lipoprotein-releasing system permease protein
MDLPFELHIALRYLLAKRKQAFISVITLVSTIGVAVGVMAVIIALAVMTGLQQTLRDRILGSQPHVYVSRVGGGFDDYHADVEKLRTIPHVTGVAPMILGKALASASGGQDFITVKGIDPALEPGITDVQRAMKSGSLAALARSTTSTGPDGIVLGQDLANTLRVSVGIPSSSPPGRALSPLGMLPAKRRLRVVGIFSLGYTVRFRVRTGLDRRREALFDRQDVDYISSTSTTSTPRRLSRMKSAPGLATSTRRRTGGR